VPAMHALLRAWQLQPTDFDIVVHEACDVGRLLGLEAVVAVRCLSNDEERLYPAGDASAHLGQFIMDLASGCFASRSLCEVST